MWQLSDSFSDEKNHKAVSHPAVLLMLIKLNYPFLALILCDTRQQLTMSNNEGQRPGDSKMTTSAQGTSSHFKCECFVCFYTRLGTQSSSQYQTDECRTATGRNASLEATTWFTFMVNAFAG